MIIREGVLKAIRDGTITLAFRRWRRPSVRSGGSLLTSIGKLQIGEVTPIEVAAISVSDARKAGYSSRDELLAELASRSEGMIYRIELGPVSPDPRVVLRQSRPDEKDLPELKERLRRLDARAAAPWTLRVLELLEAYPAVRAADLCKRVGQERLVFKVNVRKLKALGLTQSLELGYRLSPRGAALLRAIRENPSDAE